MRPPVAWQRRFIRLTSMGSPDECWPWQGYVDRNGYGQFRMVSLVGAHVAAHEFWIGPVPKGMEVDHVAARGCTRKDCTNPRHLEAVPPALNLLRFYGEVCAEGHPREGNRAANGTCKPCNARWQRERRARSRTV